MKQFYKRFVPQYESDLMSVVYSVILSTKETDLHFVKSGSCNASCIRWQGSGKVPVGDHEYIDVVNFNNTGSSERLIIDINFRSHFEIARAVDSYDRILKSLLVVYVGSLMRLKQYLQVMVDAARSLSAKTRCPFLLGYLSLTCKRSGIYLTRDRISRPLIILTINSVDDI
ncbi:hypothetical protein Dsin_004040 [Dipteronia sinensis]|uniref:Uncharacterized protein n=1 Tax=Dipteronia sinensis TaxID=43782 RepID=A0AAE0BAM7_9ROSI|nr:hypothetical protein Dsin_004040 [Dipteronia sinensis]